jgi:MFS transporter, AAHS family, 4-hydroxybenzoate transporter
MNSDTRMPSVGVLIEELPLSRFQIQVFALCGLIMLLDGFDALCMGFLAPAIVDDLGIPLRTFGSVFAASLFGLMVAGNEWEITHERYRHCAENRDVWRLRGD